MTAFECEPCDCGGACDNCNPEREEPLPYTTGVDRQRGLLGTAPGDNYLGEHDPRL